MPAYHFVLPAQVGAPERSIVVGSAPITFGRGPSNHVVVTDDTASWHHALVWTEGGSGWVKDLGSTNGTFVNGERVRGAHVLNTADRLRIGARFELVLQGDSVGGEVAVRAYALQEVDGGASFPLHADRFVIGGGDRADLRISGLPPEAAVLLVHSDEVWLGEADQDEERDRPIAVGEVFAVGGRRFVLKSLDPTRAPTIGYAGDRYPYKLHATLSGATGPEATLEDPRDGSRCVLPGNRAVLLYVLGRARQEGMRTETDEHAGWYEDDALTTDIWGRTPLTFDANNLNVLVYRTRAGLRSSGIEPWCIEKRKGYTRVRVAEVTLGD